MELLLYICLLRLVIVIMSGSFSRVVIQVLEADREQVALVNSEVLAGLGIDGILKETNHVLETLSLLGNSSQENFTLHV